MQEFEKKKQQIPGIYIPKNDSSSDLDPTTTVLGVHILVHNLYVS